jgi:hypothetical protein
MPGHPVAVRQVSKGAGKFHGNKPSWATRQETVGQFHGLLKRFTSRDRPGLLGDEHPLFYEVLSEKELTSFAR